MFKVRKRIAFVAAVLAATTMAGCVQPAATVTPTPAASAPAVKASSPAASAAAPATAAQATATPATAVVTTATAKSDEMAAYKFDPAKTYDIEWCVAEPNAPTPDDAAIKLILEKRFNVKFKMWYVDRAKRDELLNVRFASGEFPDVLFSSKPVNTANYVKQKLITELPKEAITTYMPKISKVIDDVAKMEGMSPYVVTSVDGKNYGVPSFNYNGKYHYTSIWRKDWLDAVGITKIPETIKEFETAFYAIRDNKQKLIDAKLTAQKPENIYGLSSGRKEEPFASIYGAFGSIPFYWEKSGKDELQYGAIQPGMKDALALLAKWYKDGVLNPEYITGENRGDHWAISHDFVEGRIAYTNNAPFYQNMPAKTSILTPKGGKMYRAFVAANPPEAIADGRPPIGPDGKSGSIIWGTTTGASVVFAKRLEGQKDKLGRILTMIDEISTNQEDFILLNYGVENEHWKIVDGVKKSVIPEGEPVEKYGLGASFAAWGEAIGLTEQDDPKYHEYGRKVATLTNTYRNALVGGVSGGIKMPSHDKYWDEIDKLQKQVYNDIITGKKPIEAFDQFVIDWKKQGGDQITKEANEWYKSAK